MAKEPKAQKPKTEDPEQSRRFLDAVRDLEAAGELNPTDGERALDAILRRGMRNKGESGPNGDA